MFTLGFLNAWFPSISFGWDPSPDVPGLLVWPVKVCELSLLLLSWGGEKKTLADVAGIETNK